MKRFLFPAVLLLVLSAVLVGQDALAGTGMGIKLPEDPTKAYITLGILVVAAIMFFTEIVPLPITALLVPVALSLTKVITSKVAFSYFGDPTVILFMAMFIVGEATFITGFADKVGALAVRLSKGNTVLLLVYTMAAVGLALWGMLAVAGVDIMELLNGAMDAKEAYDLRSFDNPVWLYAAVRNLLYRNGKALEIFESFEPGFKMFGGWWQQLFGESEGKDGKGLFPVTAEFTADLHSLGQMIQQGQRNIFETMVRFDPPAARYTIGSDWKNLDGLNYLEGKTLDFVDEKAYLGTLAAHVDGGVPVITMDCGELNDRKVGELFFFLELCCGVSAYVLDVNPFNQPGVEFYKRNMFQLLGKPGYEKQ